MSFNGIAPILFGGGPSMATLTPGVSDPELGTRVSYAGNEYVYIYNAGNSSMPVGYLGVTSGTSGYSVTVSSVTGTDFPLGIVKHVAIPSAAYGYLLTRGYSTVQMHASDSAAVGSLLGVGVNGVVALKSNATLFAGPSIGQSRDAIASGTSGTAYLSFP